MIPPFGSPPPLIGGPIVGGTTGSIIFVNPTGKIAQDNANFFWDDTNNRLGVLTASPSNAISLGGEAARTIAMERRTASNVAGSALTIQAGSATLLATNKAGGALNIAAGQSTGSGAGGAINFQTSTRGSSGTGTNALSTKVSIGESPATAITITGKYNQTYTVATGGVTGFTQTVTGNSLGSGDQFIGQSWNYTPASLTDASAGGLQMQLIATVSDTDSGGSSLQGFAFEIYEDGDHTANTGVSGGAVGGFIRHSSSATGLSFTAFNADIQSGSSAAAADFTIYSASASAFSGPVTTWKGFYSNNPGAGIVTGSIVNAYAFYAEAITGATNNYGIYLGGGLNVLGGNTRIGGTTDPTVALDVTGAGKISTTLDVMGIITSSGGITMADAKDIVLNTTTGTKIGTATGQKLAFHNSTPVIQRAGAAQAAAATTASTNIAPYGYTTSAQADAIVTLVNEIRATLVEKGLMKGSA